MVHALNTVLKPMMGAAATTTAVNQASTHHAAISMTANDDATRLRYMIRDVFPSSSRPMSGLGGASAGGSLGGSLGAIGQVGGGATSASQSGLSQQYPTSFVNAIHAQMKQDGLRVNPDFVDKVGEVNMFF